MSKDRTLSMQMRLRPIRLAFLLRPDDATSIRAVIGANTTRWGGQFNALVPVFKRTPAWWDYRPGRASSAKSIIRGYLDAFEPDYVVATREKLGEDLDLEKGVLVSLEDVLSASRDEPVSLGIGIIELYRHLYRREFQFVRRNPGIVAVPQPTQQSMALFLAATFGAFPQEPGLAFFEQGYRDAFGAEDMAVDSSNLFKFALEIGTPLKMGGFELDVHRRGWRRDPALFFLDGNEPRDLIDFWNLRALGWLVVPIPKQWATGLLPEAQNFVRSNNVPFPDNPSMRHSTILLKSRSVSKTEFESFASQLKVEGQNALVCQHWYPRIWDAWARDKDHVLRCDLVAEDQSTQSNVVGSSIEFRAPEPEFAETSTPTSDPRW